MNSPNYNNPNPTAKISTILLKVAQERGSNFLQNSRTRFAMCRYEPTQHACMWPSYYDLSRLIFVPAATKWPWIF